MAGRSDAWVCGRSLRIQPEAVCLPVVSVACCQVEVSGVGAGHWSRGVLPCGVSECDREALIMRGPWPTGS